MKLIGAVAIGSLAIFYPGCVVRVQVPDYGQQVSDNTSALGKLDNRMEGVESKARDLASVTGSLDDRVGGVERGIARIKNSPQRYWTLEKGKSYSGRNYDAEFGSVLQLAIAKNLDPVLAEKMRVANVLLIGELVGDPEHYGVIAAYDVDGNGLREGKVIIRDSFGRPVIAEDVIFNGLDSVGDIDGFKVLKSDVPQEINRALAESRLVQFNPRK